MQALRFLQTEVAKVADYASIERGVLRELIALSFRLGVPYLPPQPPQLLRKL